jgi:ribonuclease HI
MKCKNAMSIPYYVVKKGIVPGVYRTWRDCQEQIKDYPSSFYKKFDNMQEAYKFLAVGTCDDDKIESQSSETIKKEKESFKEKLKNKQKLQKSIIENILSNL